MGTVPIPQGATIDDQQTSPAPVPIPQGATIGDPDIAPVTTSTNPKLAAALAQKNASPAAGAVALTAAPAFAAEGIGAAGSAAASAAAAKLIPHVKDITAWAKENPMHAYVIFQVLKELIPGAKKAIGLVKSAPGAGE